MLNLQSILLALIVTAGTLPAYGKDLSFEELKKIQEKIKSPEALSVDFDQIRLVKLRNNRAIKQTGHAVFVKPNKFRWQLITPLADEWIFNGKELFNYKPAEKVAQRFVDDKSAAVAPNQIVDIVMNMDSLLKKYSVTKATQSGELVTVDLKPKASGDVNALLLRLSTKDNFVSYLKLSYADGNTSEITFKNPSRAPVSPEVFQLPKNIKVTTVSASK